MCIRDSSYTGNQTCPYFQCWKYAKGFHNTSVSLSVKKAEEAVLEYFKKILDGADFSYVYKGEAPSEKDISQIESLQQELEHIAVKEQRVRAAYENEIDTLEEYRENRRRLSIQREELSNEIYRLESQQNNIEPSPQDVLKEIQTVYDIIQNSDITYETKGMFIRTVLDQIIYDKESGCLYFDIIIS